MIGDILLIGLLIALVCFVFWYYRKSARLARSLVTKDLTRVAGWLALLCFGLFFAPLRDIGDFSKAVADAERQYPSLLTLPAWANFQKSAWIASGLAYVVTYSAIWKLARRRTWSSVLWGMAAILVLGPVLTVVRGFFVSWSAFGYSPMDEDTFKGAVLTSISAAIWITYLSKSKRVKARYGAGATP